MKKVLSILLILMVLFMASCSDDKNTPNSNGKDDEEQIDERLLGKWKVEYSKTITPAIYIENEEDLNKRPNNQDLVIGLNHPDDATVLEYFGNWGEPNVIPESGMFNRNEINIEITKNKNVVVSIGGGSPKTISFNSINDGYLISGGSMQNGVITPYTFYKYSFEGGGLIVELIRSENIDGSINPILKEYRISKYSKITE